MALVETVSVTPTEIVLGESIIITYTGNRGCELVDNNEIIYTLESTSSNTYEYVPSGVGEHTLEIRYKNVTNDSTSFIVYAPSSILQIGNKKVQDLSINGKTVQSIKNLNTNKIIYTKSDDVQPIVYNPSFSFNNEGYVIGSDLDPNYNYIIVQRDDAIIDLINSEILETNNAFSLYDVDIYYCNPSDIEYINESYLNSGESFKDFAETATDVLFYYSSLKDMIRVDSVSSTKINITLHNFYTTGNYTCNARGLDDKAYYSNERVRTDPFSFQISSKYSLTFPVTIYLRDVYMELLQTKTVEFENSGGTPEK